MKIKRTIIVTLLFLFVLSGCGYSNKLPTTEKSQTENNDQIISGTKFKKVPGRDDLVYDIDTKNVYYMFSIDYMVVLDNGESRGFLGVYLGEYGHPCKYINGKITEYEYLNGEFIYYT